MTDAQQALCDAVRLQTGFLESLGRTRDHLLTRYASQGFEAVASLTARPQFASELLQVHSTIELQDPSSAQRLACSMLMQLWVGGATPGHGRLTLELCRPNEGHRMLTLLARRELTLCAACPELPSWLGRDDTVSAMCLVMQACEATGFLALTPGWRAQLTEFADLTQP